MRKFFSIFIAVLLIVGMATSSHAVPGYRQDPGTGDILGQKKFQQDPHKIFRMVRYTAVTHAGAATLPADSIVIWDLTEDDGVTITTTTTSSDSAVAGITATQILTQDTDANTAAEDVGKDNWGWLQTYGLAQVDNLLLIQNAGDAMGTSTTLGEANPHQGAEADGTAANPRAQGVAGFFFDSSAAAQTDVECFVMLD